jgi:hypothetical protein
MVKDEITEGYREMHCEKLHSFFSSPSNIRITRSGRMRWARKVANMGQEGRAYKGLARKPQENTPLGIHRCKYQDKNKIDFK